MARWLRPARVVQVLLGLITASLVLSLVWTAQAPNLAFFLMPSRFWELSAGAPAVGVRIEAPACWWVRGCWVWACWCWLC